MYSRKVIERKREVFARANGWEPQEHTIAEVREFVAYVDSVIIEKKNSKNAYFDIACPLKESEIRRIHRFVQNEQILCSIDCGYWETRYAYVCNEKGEIFQFANRRSQEVFDAIVAGFDEREVAIELLVLKARQVGITTKTALKFLHRLLFIPNTQAVMASVRADKSELIARILNICFERCPWWLVPDRTSERVGKKMGFANNSVLSVQSGMQATGIAQGWTPTAIHISELSDIPNPRKTIEEGLLRATHPSRKLFQVFEGTGGGNTGWLADKWRAAKEDWPYGRSRLCPVFLSWPLATDLYPEGDWIAKFPVPVDWHPLEETRRHVQRAEGYIRMTPALAAVCGEKYVMPREQQWFWEFNYLEAVKSRTERIWRSQMPADDIEALIGKNDLVFAPELIEVRTKEAAPPMRCYTVVGNTVDRELEVPEQWIDYDEPRIPITFRSYRGERYDWLLVPLKPFDESQERESLDRLLVYEPPKEGRDYAIGIDTADGLGHEDEDRTTLCVTLSETAYAKPDIQVAEFASLKMNPPQTVGIAAALAAWYGAKTRDPRGAKFCIEQRERPGDDCQHQLKLMGFSYHHVMTRYDDKKVKADKGQKQGWYTTAWSRPFILNRFVDAINNGWFKPNSKYLLRELGDFERKFTVAGKSKMEHSNGKHDDRIWAAALSYITKRHMDVLRERSTVMYVPQTNRVPEITYAQSALNSFNVGE